MRSLLILPLILAVAAISAAAAEPVPDQPTRMTERGKLLFSDDLRESPLPNAWKANKGKWEITDGALRGIEAKENMHAAVVRHAMPGHDLVIQFAFKLDGTQRMGVNIDDAQGHNCVVVLTPETLSLIKAHEKRMFFDTQKVSLKPGTWHTLVIEVCGQEILASVDGSVTALGSDSTIDVDKTSFAISVAGESGSVRDFRAWAATPNKDWDKTKTKLRPSK
jgi:hypothetical protein